MLVLASASMATGAGLMAAASTTPGWETYGPLGLLAAGLLAFASKAYKREADRGDRLEAELRALTPLVLRAVEQMEARDAGRSR